MQAYDPYGRERPYIIDKSRPPRKKSRMLGVLLLLTTAVAAGIVVYCVLFKSTFTVKGRTFYAVITTVTETEAEAVAASDNVRKAGGSGYIVNDGTYRIVAAVYADSKAAETVAGRMNGASVLTLDVKKMKFKGDDRAANARLAETVYYAYTELFDDLYALSIELDEKRTSESAAVRQLAGWHAEAADRLEYLDDLVQKTPEDAVLVRLKNAYVGVTNALSAAGSAADTPPSSRVKYAISETVALFSAFSATL